MSIWLNLNRFLLMSVTSPSMHFPPEFIVPEMHFSQWGRSQVQPENTLLPFQKTLPKSHKTLKPLGSPCLIRLYSSQSLQMNETMDAFSFPEAYIAPLEL